MGGGGLTFLSFNDLCVTFLNVLNNLSTKVLNFGFTL